MLSIWFYNFIKGCGWNYALWHLKNNPHKRLRYNRLHTMRRFLVFSPCWFLVCYIHMDAFFNFYHQSLSKNYVSVCVLFVKLSRNCISDREWEGGLCPLIHSCSFFTLEGWKVWSYITITSFFLLPSYMYQYKL